MTDPSPIDILPETPADPDTREVEPLVIPYDAVLVPVVGHLEQLDVGEVGGGVLRFSGIDGEGRTVSGTMTPTFVTGEDGRSIEVSWEIDVSG